MNWTVKNVKSWQGRDGIGTTCTLYRDGVKKEILKVLVGKVDYPPDRIRFRCVRHPFFTDLSKFFYPRGKRIFRDEALADVGPLALAIWYMDDGNITSGCAKSGRRYPLSIRFCTHSCSKTDRKALKKVLKRVGGAKRPVDCFWKNPRDLEKPYFGIKLNKEDSMSFLDVVEPYIIGTGMEYKLKRE